MTTHSYSKIYRNFEDFLFEYAYMKTLSRQQRRNISEGLNCDIGVS